MLYSIKTVYKQVNHSPLVTVFYYIIRKIFGPLVRLIWIKEVHGISHIPKSGPVIVAFNHQSYFDFICFIAVSPRNVHFLAAEKFFEHPILNLIMRIFGQIRVNRKEKNKDSAHAEVLKHLRAGKVIGIFPEGTRCPDKDVMLRAFHGVAKYATMIGAPVIPIGIKGAYEVMSRFDRRPKLIKNISFHIGRPIYFDQDKDGILTKREYVIATHDIMLKIAELSGKAYPYACEYL